VDEDGAPPWLTSEQTRAWIALASAVAWLPASLEDQLQRDSGLSFVEYMVLSWLSMRPGRAGRMSEIAAMANVRRSHLSRIAARLEARGWMRRDPDPDDGRATLAVLTEAGLDTVVRAAPGHVAEVQRLVFDGLSPAQVDHLGQIGEHIVHAARPDLCLPSLDVTAG